MIFVVSIPVMVINFFYSYNNKDIFYNIVNKEEVNTEDNSVTIRVLRSNGNIETMDLEDYLIGVVPSESPLSFEDEALKAQAVAARTYALKQIQSNYEYPYDVTDDTYSQVYSDMDTLRYRWGEDFDTNYNRIKNIVDSTKGEYVSYDGDVIYALFFSTSNGYTEDNVDVFGTDLPYLKIVDSSFDEEETDNFYVTKSFSKEEFYSDLGLEYSDTLNITDIKRTNSNRVSSLYINGNYYSGISFQYALGLRSNDFTIEETDTINITTKGFGHGVGLSQYGANALAKRNKTYDEILKYYYQGTELQKL